MTKKETYIAYIIKHLINGEVGHDKVFTYFHRKFSLTRPTFDKYWKLANERYGAAILRANSEMEESIIKSAKDACDAGLMTKLERQLIIQNRIDYILEMLKTGYLIKEEIIVKGKKGVVQRTLTLPERLKLDAQLVTHLTYLSKTEADFREVVKNIHIVEREIVIGDDDDDEEDYL